MQGLGESYAALLDAHDVVLVPSYAFGMEFNRAAAFARRGGAFGSVAQSFPEWVSSLWELYGDGRMIAGDTQVAAALAKAFHGHEGELANRPGLAVAVLTALKRVSGLPEFASALDGSSAALASLLGPERELLSCIAAAKETLAGAGYIELGDAAAWLAGHPELVASDGALRIALVSDAPLAPIQEHLVSSLVSAGAASISLFTRGGEPVQGFPEPALSKPREGVGLRFAFPSGDYAVPQLVLSLVEEGLDSGRIAISCAKPLDLYRAVAPVLAERGIRVAVRDMVSFARTSFGRAYGSLRACLEHPYLPWNRASLIDALSSPLLRGSIGSTWAKDISVRGDRLLDRDEVITALLKESGIFDALYELVAAPSINAFRIMEERIAHNSPLERTEVAEALGALDFLETLHMDGLRFGMDAELMAEAFKPLLDRSQVSVPLCNYEMEPGLSPQVSIMGQYQASQLGIASTDTLIVLDLDSATYPAGIRDDAISLLLGKLGVDLGEDRLSSQRRLWSRLAQVPSGELILGRCLNDADAEPRYHCVPLEEFIDLYRSDPSAIDDIANLYGLPEELQRDMVLAGEDDLVANVDLRTGTGLVASEESLGCDAAPLIAFRSPSARSARSLVLSPSQIGAYIECPAKWFAQRRLGASEPTEYNGPIEQGSFRHDVLQEFYRRFMEAGLGKVRPSNRDIAEQTLGEAFDAVLKEHLLLRAPGRRAPFLLATTEERVIELIGKELDSWLDFEERLLAPFQDGLGRHRGYEPAALEFDITPFEIDYAGAKLVGRIDRVDIDALTGAAAVIDYKGSLSAYYDLSLDKEGTPNIAYKLQSLIYAHALMKSADARSALGLAQDPVIAGALYVSYRRGNAMRGTYDPAHIAPEVLPTLPSSVTTYDQELLPKVLESIEEQVEEAVVAPMLEGKVEPAPSSPGACRYCTVYGCPRRS